MVKKLNKNMVPFVEIIVLYEKNNNIHSIIYLIHSFFAICSCLCKKRINILTTQKREEKDMHYGKEKSQESCSELKTLKTSAITK